MTNTTPLSAGRFVGQKVLRKEDPRLLTGRGRYVDDVSLKGMLHATFVRSHVARARITRLDVEAARGAPGVIAVFTGADLNDKVAGSMLPSLFQGAEDFMAPIFPLAQDDVRFVGDPIALVIAESRYLAEDAAELVEVDYEQLTAVIDYESAATNPETVHPNRPANVAMMMGAPLSPELQQVLDGAPHTVTETFRQHRYSMVPMECRGVVARFDPFDHQLDVWFSSQNPHEARLAFSRVTGLPEHSVRVQIGDVGGGFGLKSFVGREEQTIVLAAYLLKRAVKWIEDRHEHLIASAHARVEKMTITMAVDDDGQMLGAYVDHVDDSGAYPIGGGSAGGLSCALLTGPYKVPALGFQTTTVWTNTCGKAAYRGPWMMETVGREQMVEVVARAIGMDPVELRRRNVIHRADLPYTSAGGQFIDNVSPEETLEQCVTEIGYDSFRAEQAKAKAEGRLLGIGFAVYVEPQTRFGPYGNEPAHLRIAPDGHVDVYIASGAHGQGLETTTAQLTAEFLGVHVDDVTVHQGDTESTPYGPGTGGSRSGPMIGAAVHDAAVALREKVFAIAGHLLEAAPEDLDMEDSVISVVGTPAKSITLLQVAKAAHMTPGELPDDVDPILEVMHRYKAPDGVWSNACHVCTCEVDAATGEVALLRYVVSEDCGKMINPNIVEGQIAGGVAQGIGGVLYEHNVYDEAGNPLASTFLDYLVPTSAEIPDVECHHIETAATTPGGFKGVGEGGAIGAPPAVFNAVADALAQAGATVTDQPLDPSRVLAAIRAAAGNVAPVTSILERAEPYYDPYDYEVDANAHAVWKRLRDEAPLYYNDKYDFYALSRFDDVLPAMLDTTTFSSAHMTVLEMMGPEKNSGGMMIFMDPPEHTNLRKLVSRAFTPRAINGLEDRVRRLCSGYLDQFVGAGTFDFVDDFAALVPPAVILALLGFPEESADEWRHGVDAMFHMEESEQGFTDGRSPEEILRERQMDDFSLFEMLPAMLEQRRRDPEDDLISVLVHSDLEELDGTTRKLTNAEIGSFVTLLSIAGTETVARLLSWAAVLLARNPDQREVLVADPGVIPNGIEEMLRYEAPSPVNARWVNRDLEYHGKQLPEDSKLILLNGSADRDERHFPNADVFDVRRKIDRHTAFGYGTHFCVGAALARLESRIAIEETLVRFPTWDVHENELEWVHTSTVRGYAKVPVHLG